MACCLANGPVSTDLLAMTLKSMRERCGQDTSSCATASKHAKDIWSTVTCSAKTLMLHEAQGHRTWSSRTPEKGSYTLIVPSPENRR